MVQRRLALVQVLTHREPALLISGQTVSMFGDGVANVALTWLVLNTWHSPSLLGWFAAARMAPLVAFLLVGGVIVDRFSRRVLLLLSDAVRALLTAVLVVLLALGHLHYWELIAFAVLFGLFDAVFTPAMTALTPEIVSEDLLPAMNSVRPLAANLFGGLLGPAVGGALAAWSTTWAIGIDCATFVASASALALMRATPRPARHEERSMTHDIREGLVYARRTPWFWSTVLGVTLSNALLFSPSAILIPYFLRHTLHASALLVGFSFAAFGVSGSLGALVVGNLKSPRRRVRTMWTVWIVAGLSALTLGVATNYWEVLIFPVVSSPLLIWGNVIWESMMQTEVPRELLGRASSVDWFVSLGLAPVGLVVAGYLSGVMGVRAYFVMMAVTTCLPGLLILASRRINAIDRDRLSPAQGIGSIGATASE